MQRCFGLVTAILLFLSLPEAGFPQRESDIPPMLEGNRPLVVPQAKPDPRPPGEEQAISPTPAKTGKAKVKPKHKGAKVNQATVAGKKKGKTADKKKRDTAKPRGKAKGKRT